MVCVHEPASGRAGPPVQDLWLFSTALKKGSLLARTQIEETQDSPADLVRHGFCAPACTNDCEWWFSANDLWLKTKR